MTETAMTRYFSTGVALMILTAATFAFGGEKKQPTTKPAPQIKRCCVDDKGHYHPEWAHGINCPHNHKYCR
jgi:hypothetical protein